MRPTGKVEKLVVNVNSSDRYSDATSPRGNVDGIGTGLSTPTTAVIHPLGSPGVNYLSYTQMEPAELITTDDGLKEGNEFGLQVQVRTREGGRRSSLAPTPTHQLRRVSSNCWNPYGSETSSPLNPSLIVPETQKDASSVSVSQELLKEPLPFTVVHSALHGKCRFIPFPPLQPYDPPPPPLAGGSFPLFVGQVRFETTPAELVWLFRRACGACAYTVEGRGNGCFILHLKSEAERGLVRQLHKRILFDIGGVWFARSSEEVDSLCEYVALVGPYLSRKAKLPRDSMVVEDIRIDCNDTGSSYPFYHQESPFHSFGVNNNNTWGSSTSARSTPTRAHYNSRPPSPLTAPLSQAHYGAGGQHNKSTMDTFQDSQ